MDKIIFGDNQFFGVNHMSEERAQAQLERFRMDSAIIETIDAAYAEGIRGFMFSTHDRVRGICAELAGRRGGYSGARFYPVLPYAQKYASIVAEKGLMGLVRDSLISNNSPSGILSSILHGSVGVLTQDIFEVMKALVDAEMLLFRNLEIGVVFLQNVVADLLLGLRIGSVFVRFAEYVRKRYSVEVGFMTMNLPAMVSFLKELGFENPIVCASINKIGYLMNPDRSSYERELMDGGFRGVAMSVFASGAIRPEEAISYLGGFPNMSSVVFGASSRSNIITSKRLIDEMFASRK